MNTALRELERVAQEMRERRVNNGKSVSPTLIAWADRITSIIAALGEGQEVAPVAWRGYAKLGIGAYLIEHSAESEPAALMLCIASDEEKAGRTVGDLKTFEGERQPIPAEKMTVRIDFANVAGLDALEQQLRILREVHFPASPAHTSDARDGERLDWIAANLVAVYPELDGPWYADVYRDGEEGEVTASHHAATPREAIDAAMRQEGE